MEILTLLDWQGKLHEFDFVGWKADHSALFVLDAAKQKLVIPLNVPTLRWMVWKCPFPAAVPVRIERWRLRPPPCRASAEAAKALAKGTDPIAMNWPFSVWESFYGLIMFAEERDRPELGRRWQELKTASDNKKLSTYSLDEALAGDVGGILSNYLHEEFTKMYGFDLQVMKGDSAHFRRTATRFATRGTARIFDSNTRSWQIESALQVNEREWEVLEALVKYRVVFQNGETVWLSDAKPRALHDATESEEFEKCLRNLARLNLTPVSRDDACTQLGCSDKTLRNYCAELSLNPNRLTRHELEGLIAHQRMKNKRPHLIKKNKSNKGARF